MKKNNPLRGLTERSQQITVMCDEEKLLKSIHKVHLQNQTYCPSENLNTRTY